MPTGYTAGVATGEVTDLRTFALKLARGMGALITMRDAPDGAPIPERIEPTDRYKEKLAELESERAALKALTAEEAQAKAHAAYQRDQEAQRKHFANKAEQRARYETMIAKVEAWEGAPEGIKEFALEQLRESLQFDCGGDDKWYGKPVSSDGEEWRAATLAEIDRSLAFYGERQAEELSRTAERNAWLKQLHDSLEEKEIA